MKQILLIENDRPLQLLIKEELVDEGYVVWVVSDGFEAISMLNGTSYKPDLIILDVRLSQKDVFEFIGRTLKLGIDIPVIIYTSYTACTLRPLTYADAYVIKSHDLSILKATIHDLLHKKVHNKDKTYEGRGEYV